MQITPIPAYFVFDKFEQELDTGLVHERILKHSTTNNALISYLKAFLRAGLSAHNAGDTKPYLPNTVLSSLPTIQARQWTKEKFGTKCPSLCTTPLPHTLPHTALAT